MAAQRCDQQRQGDDLVTMTAAVAPWTSAKHPLRSGGSWGRDQVGDQALTVESSAPPDILGARRVSGR